MGNPAVEFFSAHWIIVIGQSVTFVPRRASSKVCHVLVVTGKVGSRRLSSGASEGLYDRI